MQFRTILHRVLRNRGMLDVGLREMFVKADLHMTKTF